MKFLLCGGLAVYIFLLASISRTTGFIKVLGNSSDELFLVGYSHLLENHNAQCVKSKYHWSDNHWVTRSLEFKYRWGGGRPTNYQIYIKVRVEKHQVFFEVQNTSALLFWFEPQVRHRYQIRYNDNHSLVLSNLIEDVWVHQPCSLWVTKDALGKIPQMANETFQTVCNASKFVGFGHCFS
uniref:Putative group viii salivary lipocalin n=1 Tax=Rhipicephalus pulchellus TaxID=72859 RepID=L7MC10_RHIPC